MTDTHTRTQHTPGSWTYAEARPADGPYISWEIRGPDSLCHIALVQFESDARVIAAAPDMLDALIDVEAEQGFDDTAMSSDVIERVRAAIAKARGEDA